MLTVQEIAAQIVRREGGYVNDPDDPGGATNHGVTIHTMRRLGLDLNGDGHVTAEDVKSLSAAKAVEIFTTHYFEGPGIGRLPELLHATVFDMYVNAGSNAIRILQRLLNDMGKDLQVDGVLGPHTLRAAYAAATDAPDHIADAYGVARRNYYYALADKRPSARKFARRRDGGKGGWIKRAEEFMSPAYRLSRAEHRQRVAAWG